MQLKVIGSGTVNPDVGLSASCYHLEVEEKRALLLDCGYGSLARLRQFSVDTHQIQAILLTHSHPDHIHGLVPLLFAWQYASTSFQRPRDLAVTIYYPAMIQGYIEGLKELYPWLTRVSYPLHWQPVEQRESFEVLGVDCCAYPMEHQEDQAVGYLLKKGNLAFAYTGDSSPCAGLEELLSQANYALVEASFHDRDKVVGGHLSWEDLQDLLPRLSLKRCWLTHRIQRGGCHKKLATWQKELSLTQLAIAKDGELYELD